jgi:hypothetical protein
VCNYVNFDPENSPRCFRADTGEEEYRGPRSFVGVPDALFQNRGDGTFENITEEVGIVLPESKALGVVIADLDNDHWPDVWVANDGVPNFLFRNQGQLKTKLSFANVPPELGGAVNAEGLVEANMGIACGDYDESGFLSVGISHFYMEHFTLFRNLGTLGFVDDSRRAGLVVPTRSTMGWGTAFLDYDNDGWLDLFIANGHLARPVQAKLPYEMLPQLFRNTESGRFDEVSSQAGEYFNRFRVGRGVAFGDLNNDGRTDIVVVHYDEPSSLLYNQMDNGNHCLVLRLLGRESNRDAFNARVIATLSGASSEGKDRVITREILGGGSFLSASDRRIVIGTGGREKVDEVKILWPSGREQILRNVPVDQAVGVYEGNSVMPMTALEPSAG